MSQSLAECKARLASIQSYPRQFFMVIRATVTSSKTVDFSFRGPLGFEAHILLLSVESDSPGQYAFESVGGKINLMGIVDFAEIRPNCTEVTLAVHYDIRNKLFAWLDRRLRLLDAFVTAELRSIRSLTNTRTVACFGLDDYSPNPSMKPTASLRENSTVLATDPARGLSLSR
jgi:hypothetical protein